jgi:lipopolysaccharide transport system ATP-binding protein
MRDVAIRVEGLGKTYKIGKLQRRHDTLRDRISDNRLFNLFKRRNGNDHSEHAEGASAGPSTDILWALKGICFEVERGEVVGIIGRNGAGKSTLLKVLSRITEPTEGYADIRGRVGSLLEVGTGFHPELTGRENIYLNGAVLGMKKAEIENKFDEIVTFAEIEKFIDTPVKRYSSGMYLRLAFAVAAHLDTEVLVVDEVLAVGDISFQKKCLGKMQDVAGRGRTVLFVSHNMAAVQQLCERSILLQGGSLVFDGATSAVIDQYLRLNSAGGGSNILTRAGTGSNNGKRIGEIIEIRTQDISGADTSSFGIGDSFKIGLRVKLYQKLVRVSVGAEILSQGGIPLLNLRSDSQGVEFGPYDAGDEVMFVIDVPAFPVYPGTYRIQPWFAEYGGKRIDHVIEGITVQTEAKGRFLSERMIQDGRGLLVMDCGWSARVGKAQHEGNAN